MISITEISNNGQTSNRPLRVSLIGAGLFARSAHLPALQALGERVQVQAVYSRSLEKAAALAAEFGPATTATDHWPSLVQRGDIDAVAVVLPVNQQEAVVRAALAAGKHVISEKPVGPDRATAATLVGWYAALPAPRPVWMVAENWRYEAAFLTAAELIQQGAIGRPLLLHLAAYTPMDGGNRYYHTSWRRAGDFAGGFLLDGGVHHVAAMRLLVGEIAAVTGEAHALRADLPPVDTLAASLHFASGVVGSYLATWAVGTPFQALLTITGSAGSLRVDRGQLELARGGGVELIPVAKFNGVTDEWRAFADAVQLGTPHRNGPDEALADLTVIDAILRAAVTGVRVAVATA
jgi:predicted dehydrogenase